MMYIKRNFHYRQNFYPRGIPFLSSEDIYSLGGVSGSFTFPLAAEALLVLLPEVAGRALLLAEAVVLAEAVALAGAVTVAALPATCAAGCSSQWNGSKLLFGSTQDGFLEA